MLSGALTDVRTHMAGQLHPTFPSRFPLLRLDHIFASKEVSVTGVEVIANPLAKLASDHLPLLATIEI
jgi:endonuclease/exonuclease/phosphatase family metal-dependent hydrolase